MELMNNVNSPLSVEEQAKELHKSIVYNYRMAARHLVDAARYLKEMRDTKAYISLGMETFEEYTEQMAGIKARQAYTYISTLERLGQPMMEEHADLGITKLSLLAEITPIQRDEFATENDLAGMTVKEIEELVAEHTRRGEQLTLFEEKERANAETIAALQQELDDLKAAPPEPVTATVEPDPALLKKRESEIEAAAKQKYDKKLAKVTADAQAEVAAAKKALEQMTEEKDKIEERVRREMIEKNSAEIQRVRESAAVNADGDFRAVDIYFGNMQETANRLMGMIEKIRLADQEKAARTSAALAAYFEQLAVKCKEVCAK